MAELTSIMARITIKIPPETWQDEFWIALITTVREFYASQGKAAITVNTVLLCSVLDNRRMHPLPFLCSASLCREITNLNQQALDISRRELR